MKGADHCRSCEATTPHELVARRATKRELVVAGWDGFEGAEKAASIGWTCLHCGGTSPGSVERLVVLLAALGCEPRPVRIDA